MEKKPYYETRIGKIIDQYGDSRFQFAILSCILDEGILKLKAYTEEEILAIKGKGSLTRRDGSGSS